MPTIGKNRCLPIGVLWLTFSLVIFCVPAGGGGRSTNGHHCRSERYPHYASDEKLVATHISPDVVIDDQDIDDYYRRHNARYRVPERLHIRHISLRFPPDADEIQKSLVRDRIREIARQLSAGRDFAELAHRYSEDPSRQKGGDAGYVDAGRASQIFGERVLAVPTGQVSPPLETPTGYHLVTIEDREFAREIPLEDVRETIRHTLYRQRTTAPVMAFVKTLRAKAHIIIRE